MTHLQTECKSERLIECLEFGAPDQLPPDLEQHLAECVSCRDELEKRAAEPDFWDEAAHLLSNEPTSDRKDDSDDVDMNRARVSIPGLMELLGPTDDPNMLGRLGEYEVSGVIGVGGMGAVLKGFDRSLHRVVAIKVMAPHLAHCGSARNRFQREARAAAAITHDNVIDIYRVADTNGIPYLVMPFARGQSLQKRIDDGGPLATIEVLRIGRQIASGLSAAHEQGLVHRDIKPANVLLSDGIERLVITDFGVARAIDDASMTQTGLIAGTPQYMSPEQARGEQVDCRSDLFSLGAVLYTACTGRPPFRADAAYGILRRITDTDPRPIQEINPEIPAWLCNLIERLLAKHPADRFENAHEVADIFEKCIAHLQQPTEVALPASLIGKISESKKIENNPNAQTQRTKRSFVAKLVASVGLITGLCFAFIYFTAPPDLNGKWTGEEWKEIRLQSRKDANHWYSGSFVDNNGVRGAIHLEWSRLQQRFKGRWQIDNGLSGSITLRAGKSYYLKGAASVDSEFDIDSSYPRLRDFEWERDRSTRATRSSKKASAAGNNSASVWMNQVDDSLLEQAKQIYKAENGRNPNSDELKKMFNPSFLRSKGINAGTGNNVSRWNFLSGGQPREWTKVKAPISGLVTHVNKNVTRNAMVKKGTIVIQLQSPSDESIGQQENRLAELEKKLAACKAKSEAYATNVESFTAAANFAKQTDKAQRAAKEGKLLTIESKFELYRNALSKAEGDYDNVSKMAKKGLASETEVETEKHRIELAKINLSAAQNDISVVKKELDALLASFKERDALNQTKIESAKVLYQEELSQMATLEKEIKDVKSRLAKFTRVGIAAPNDGKVSWVGQVKKGQTVKAGDVLMVIDPTKTNGSVDPNFGGNRSKSNRSENDLNVTRNSESNFDNMIKSRFNNPESKNSGSNNSRSRNLGGLDFDRSGFPASAYGDLASSFESISRIKKDIRKSRASNVQTIEHLRLTTDEVQRVNSEIEKLNGELQELKDGKTKSDSPFNTIQYKSSQIRKRKDEVADLGKTLEEVQRQLAQQEALTEELLNELETFRKLLATRFQRAEDNVKLQKQRVDQARVRFNSGVVTAEEVSRAEQLYNEGLSRAEQLMILLKFCEEKRAKATSNSKADAKKGR